MKPILLVTTLLILTSCSSSYTCDDFKTGTYHYGDSAFQGIEIIRTVDEQIETSTQEGNEYEDRYSIIWDGACSYQLVFKSTNNPNRMPFSKYDTISAQIMKIVEDGYIVKSRVFDDGPEGHIIKVD